MPLEHHASPALEASVPSGSRPLSSPLFPGSPAREDPCNVLCFANVTRPHPRSRALPVPPRLIRGQWSSPIKIIGSGVPHGDLFLPRVPPSLEWSLQASLIRGQGEKGYERRDPRRLILVHMDVCGLWLRGNLMSVQTKSWSGVAFLVSAGSRLRFSRALSIPSVCGQSACRNNQAFFQPLAPAGPSKDKKSKRRHTGEEKSNCARCLNGKDGKNQSKNCISPESNRGLADGNGQFYH